MATSSQNYAVIVKDPRLKLTPKVKPIQLSKLEVKLRKSTERSPRESLQDAIGEYSIQSQSDEGEHQDGYIELNDECFFLNKGPMTSDRFGGPEFEGISEVVAAVDHSYMFAPVTDSQPQ